MSMEEKRINWADYKRRQEDNGEIILEGDGGMRLSNGTYSVHKFVHKLKPVYAKVPVTWIPKDKEANDGKPGIIQIEDDNWNGSVPVMHASRSNVRFYGCYLDPDENDSLQITSKNNAGMYDFNYTHGYGSYIKHRDHQKGKGGCRLERHEFAHIETPLDREGDSGVFVLGKLIHGTNENGGENGKQSLCLTAFIIARGQTLFVPPNTIHTNDYQRGLWRTYLEEDYIDVCDLVKKKKHNQTQHMLLKFWCGLTKKRMYEYELKPLSITGNRKKDDTREQFVIDDDEKYDVRKHDDAIVCHCICGEELEKIKARDVYENPCDLMCHSCSNYCDDNDLIYHCPNEGNKAEHKHGYDLCSKCAEQKVLKFVDNRDSDYIHLSSQILSNPIYTVLPITSIPNLSNDGNVGLIQIEDYNWDGSIPTMFANKSNVRFYDCYLDPDEDESPQIECSNDFNYTDLYIKNRNGQNEKGGCRLETHNFAHFETPLSVEGKSGVFVLGKLIDAENENGGKTGEQSLCLTAFVIAKGQKLYVPPDTFHTNDYQRGEWRTYVEHDKNIDPYDLVKQNKNKKKEHIQLTFYCGLTKKRIPQYDKIICHCICGAILKKSTAKDCYGTRSVQCNGCDRIVTGNNWVYHCPYKRNKPEHMQGYDLCITCFKVQCK